MQERKFSPIGWYYPATADCEERIERAMHGEGSIFKDEQAFKSGSGVCYIPELSDSKYTRADLLKLCHNDVSIATQLFSSLDWQHPESVIEDWHVNGELDYCSACGKLMMCYEVTSCPHCGAAYEGDEY